MPIEVVTVLVSVRIDDVEPTGEPCEGCGETPWLKARQAVATARLPGSDRQIAIACETCAEMVVEDLT